jgi:phosphatidylglycerophosphate synthase
MRRSKALSLPNLLTYGRLVAVPAVVALLFWPEDTWSRWAALTIFILAAGPRDLCRSSALA